MLSADSILRTASARVASMCGWLAFRLGMRQQARRQYERVLRLKGDDFSAYVHLGRIAYDAGDYSGWRREFEHARRADPGRFARLRQPFELFEPRLAGTTFDGRDFDDRDVDGRDFGDRDFDDRDFDDRDFDDPGARATWQTLHPFGAKARIGGRRAADRTRREGMGEIDNGGFDSNSSDPDSLRGSNSIGRDSIGGGADHERDSDHSSGSDPFGSDPFGSDPFGPAGDPFGPDPFGSDPSMGPDPTMGPDHSIGPDPFAGHDARFAPDDCTNPLERERFDLLGPIRRDEIAACDLDDLAKMFASE